MSDKLKVKTIIAFTFLFFSILSLSNCKSKPVNVTGQLPKAPAPVAIQPNTSAQKSVYVYGNYFRVYNANRYLTLLEACRRCGLKRVVQGPFGQSQYQRFWTTSGDPKRCDSWNSKGYIQIEFLENKLPTTAKVLIQPQYTGQFKNYSFDGKAQEVWGEAFEITTTARPINENEGFEILVSPSEGLLGVYTMVIRSDEDNHVRDSEIYVTVSYGQSDTQTIITQQLKRLKKRAVSAPRFGCSQYTN